MFLKDNCHMVVEECNVWRMQWKETTIGDKKEAVEIFQVHNEDTFIFDKFLEE